MKLMCPREWFVWQKHIVTYIFFRGAYHVFTWPIWLLENYKMGPWPQTSSSLLPQFHSKIKTSMQTTWLPLHRLSEHGIRRYVGNISINSSENLLKIRKESTGKFLLNFRVDSCFLDNPYSHMGSPPPSTCIHSPQEFPARSVWFCPVDGLQIEHWESDSQQCFKIVSCIYCSTVDPCWFHNTPANRGTSIAEEFV